MEGGKEMKLKGAYPHVIINKYEPDSNLKYDKNIIHETLVKLIDARNELRQEGYDWEACLVLDQETFDRLDSLLKTYLKKEESFKLNVHIVPTIPCIYGTTRNINKEVYGVKVLLLEGVFK